MASIHKIIEKLKFLANPANVAGMARYGISTVGTLGISVVTLRKIARELGRDPAVAEQLWDSGIHEARLLSGLVDDPATITETRINRQIRQVDSWDICDLFCNNVLVYTPHAWRLAAKWTSEKRQFVKRAGFTLMACLAVHDKQSPNSRFRDLLRHIENAAGDERNFVKKAVNWALRQIGKRNAILNRLAIAAARRIAKQNTGSARWIARDAIAELTSEKTRKIIARRARSNKISAVGKTIKRTGRKSGARS